MVLPDFLNIIIGIVMVYLIYQAYTYRKILLVVAGIVVASYIGYLIYDKHNLTKKVEQSAVELQNKTEEILQIKKTLADEEFNNTKSLGYSLNNPGNIRNSFTKFKGEVESDKPFKKFKTMKHGFRAMTSLLHTYINSDYNTVEKILNRYAPSSDGNNPRNYTNNVIKIVNVKPNQILSTADFKNGNMLNLIFAMTRVEQGYSPNIHDLHEGYMMYVREINIELE